MVDQLTIQTIGVLVAAVSVLAFMVNSILTSRREEKRSQQTLETRQAQMFMDIYRQRQSKEYIIAWKKAFQDNHWSNIDEFLALWSDNEFSEAFNLVGTYYEGIGVLVREGLLDIRYVALLICGETLEYWGKVGPVIGDARRRTSYTRFASESEYLYNELVRYLGVHPELQTGPYKSFSDSGSKPQ